MLTEVDVRAGDIVSAYYRGEVLSRLVTGKDLDARRVMLEFQDQNDGNAAWPIATNSMGVLVGGQLIEDHQWAMTLQSANAWTGQPTVCVYPDNEPSNTVAMTSIGGLVCTGLVALGDSGVGLLNIEIPLENGTLFTTLDSYNCQELRSISRAMAASGWISCGM